MRHEKIINGIFVFSYSLKVAANHVKCYSPLVFVLRFYGGLSYRVFVPAHAIPRIYRGNPHLSTFNYVRDTAMPSRSIVILLCAFFASAAFADGYPNRPVRLIVPFSPGGLGDVLARTIGQKLSETLGQQFVIDLRPGAGGNVGADIAVNAVADGYTLLVIATAHAINMSLYAKPSYDVVRDFSAVSLFGTAPHLLVVSPSVPAISVQELIALARANPGKLNLASSGNGSAGHLTGELFKIKTGINIVHVAYKGGAPAQLDLMAGRVQLFFDNIAPALPHVKAGKVRALAITSSRRFSVLPEVPTMIESGLPGFVATSWIGVVVPARTPKLIITKLNAAIVDAVKAPTVREHLARQGVDPISNSPQEFSAFLQQEIAKWTTLVKSSGAKLE